MGRFRGFLTTNLGSLLASKPDSLLGVDIGSSAIKLVEFHHHKNTLEVSSFSSETLPEDALADKKIADPDKVASAIRSAVRRARTNTKEAVVAVPGASAITRVIQMPSAMQDQEMEEQIKLQADQYIPYSAEDISLDFQVLGQKEGAQDINDVLLAACRTETVEERVAALERAGLKASVVDIDTHAVENAYALLAPQIAVDGAGQTVAIFDIGAVTTTLHVLHDGRIVYTHEQLLGGQSLIEQIARRHGLSLEEALRAQRLEELPDGHADLLQHFVDDLVQQIDNSLQLFFSSKAEYETIDQIMLAGGCANIVRLDQKAANHTGMPTAIAQPLAGLRLAPKARAAMTRFDGPTLLVACGLALRASG
jgi:type IV pilus assembly protein PilM